MARGVADQLAVNSTLLRKPRPFYPLLCRRQEIRRCISHGNAFTSLAESYTSRVLATLAFDLTFKMLHVF
jgi:hypothetical protein